MLWVGTLLTSSNESEALSAVCPEQRLHIKYCFYAPVSFVRKPARPILKQRVEFHGPAIKFRKQGVLLAD